MELAIMKPARLLIAAAGVSFVFLSVSTTTAQIDPRMPEGPNRDLVFRRCTTCHDIGNLVSTVGRTRDGWSEKIDDMVLYGLKITPEERALILDYLATYLPRD
jgi:hypothetical protein